MFYNENIKAEYLLSDISSSNGESMAKLCRQFMSYVGKYERMLDKDVGEFDRVTLETSVRRISKATKKDYDVLIILTKQYVYWRKGIGLPYNKEILEIITETERLFEIQYIKSPTHLKYVMSEKKILNNKNQQITVGLRDASTNTIDVTYRVFLWMLYFGLTKEEAIDVKVSDVDLKNKRIIYNGQTFDLCDESLEDFEKACNTEVFTYESPTLPERTSCKRKRGDLIMRGIKSEQPSLTTLTPVIQKKLCPPDVSDIVKPTCTSIARSGVFYRTYAHELLGYPPDFTDEVQKMIKNNKYSSEKAKQAAITRLSKICLSEYISWRDLFYIGQKHD